MKKFKQVSRIVIEMAIQFISDHPAGNVTQFRRWYKRGSGKTTDLGADEFKVLQVACVEQRRRKAAIPVPGAGPIPLPPGSKEHRLHQGFTLDPEATPFEKEREIEFQAQRFGLNLYRHGLFSVQEHTGPEDQERRVSMFLSVVAKGGK